MSARCCATFGVGLIARETLRRTQCLPCVTLPLHSLVLPHSLEAQDCSWAALKRHSLALPTAFERPQTV
jgi:hypothetical protein